MLTGQAKSMEVNLYAVPAIPQETSRLFLPLGEPIRESVRGLISQRSRME